jgi:hypothetical protein
MGANMSERFLHYLKREHERLEESIERERQRPLPDQLQLARLKKLKLAVRDQIAEIESDVRDAKAA